MSTEAGAVPEPYVVAHGREAIASDPRLGELGVEAPARVRISRALAHRGGDPSVVTAALAEAAS